MNLESNNKDSGSIDFTLIPGGSAIKQKILIIEDDPAIQAQLQTLLTGNDYEVNAVVDFTAVIEKVKSFRPDLILLDIKLPGRSGFDLCSQIRCFSDVPIIFVTSSNTDMDELNSIMLGGDAFITKPYNTAILLAKISSLLKKANPASQSNSFSWQGAVLYLDSSPCYLAERCLQAAQEQAGASACVDGAA